jgi:hypothetical protein
VRKTLTSGTSVDTLPLHPAVVAVNAASVAFVDELLRLPSPSAASTVVDLLYGTASEFTRAVLSHVNGGIHIPLTRLLASSAPLVTLLVQRLRVGSAWRGREKALKFARASARARYRELQIAFVTSVRRDAALEPSASLVRYTYGTDGRHWVWADAAGRVLHRVVDLNRAVLGLLAAMARGQTAVDLGEGALEIAEFALEETVLDLMAAALPVVAAPDWSRFASALEGSDAALGDEESVVRYRSLLAEILGLSTAQPGVPA